MARRSRMNGREAGHRSCSSTGRPLITPGGIPFVWPSRNTFRCTQSPGLPGYNLLYVGVIRVAYMASHSNNTTFDRLSGLPTPSEWHKTSSLPDGTPIGRLGAYWYILDQNGRAISRGYHDVSCDEHGDFIGKRSNHTEPVVLYTNHL